MKVIVFFCVTLLALGLAREFPQNSIGRTRVAARRIVRPGLILFAGVSVGFTLRNMVPFRLFKECNTVTQNRAACCGPGCRKRELGAEMHYDAKYFAWQTKLGMEKAAAQNWTMLLGVRPGDVVCDFGAGGGHILASLVATSRRIAVEINPHARQSMSSNYPFIERYKYPEDLPENSLDLVYATSAIEHFECPLTELRAIVRKIRSGGRLVVGVKNEGVSYAGRALERDIHKHLWTWNHQLLYNLLRAAGVDQVQVFPTSEKLLSQTQNFCGEKAAKNSAIYHWAFGVKN